jgi:hypothetical protein
MSKPNYTQPGLAVTDGAESTITVRTFCQAVYVFEQSTQAGWPRVFLYRGTVAGSSQQPIAAGSQLRIPGPFYPGDVAGTVELASNGGDSSVFNVQELM